MNRRSNLAAMLSTLGLFAGLVQAATPEKDFWHWFEQNDAALYTFEVDQEGTFNRLAAELHKVDPSLTFEFGPKESGSREFVISADGDRRAFPKVESLFASAPTLPHWKFVKFRPRREPFDLEYGGVSVKASFVSVVLKPEGKKVAIDVLIPGYSESARKTYMAIAFLLLDQALGEYDVETNVGQIEVQAPSMASGKPVPLRQLPSRFDSLLVGH